MFRHRGDCVSLLLLTGMVLAVSAGEGRSANDELAQFEDRVVARCTERAVRITKSDRGLWLTVLEGAYPGRVASATTEEDYAAWFVLLAGKNEAWRKDSAPNTQVAELFDRVVQRLELGPVPSIKRDEFARYARKALIPGNPPKDGANAPDQDDDADRVFRVLDRDSDGVLSREELTYRLRDERARFDDDGNGRIDKKEYRLYFQRRVTVAVETASGKSGNGDKGVRGSDGKASAMSAKNAIPLPDWFTALDSNADSQVALYEWRKAGRSITSFGEMDLDEDGLLTKEEYLRYLRLNEKTIEPLPAKTKQDK